MCNFAIEPMRPSLSREPIKSPNESLTLGADRDLRSVGRNLVEIAAVIVIVIEIAEAKFGIDAPGHLAAARTVGLHGNDGTDIKTAKIKACLIIITPFTLCKFLSYGRVSARRISQDCRATCESPGPEPTSRDLI